MESHFHRLRHHHLACAASKTGSRGLCQCYPVALAYCSPIASWTYLEYQRHWCTYVRWWGHRSYNLDYKGKNVKNHGLSSNASSYPLTQSCNFHTLSIGGQHELRVVCLRSLVVTTAWYRYQASIHSELPEKLLLQSSSGLQISQGICRQVLWMEIRRDLLYSPYHTENQPNVAEKLLLACFHSSVYTTNRFSIRLTQKGRPGCLL